MARPAAAAKGLLPPAALRAGARLVAPAADRLGSVSRGAIYRVKSPTAGPEGRNSAGRGRRGIAAKLDAEEWRDLVGAYIDAASAAVVEMGGKVAKKLGDPNQPW